MLTNTRVFLTLFVGVVLLSLSSCANKMASKNAPADPAAWEAAKSAYHEVMSKTFHPAEEGNLAPLKSRYMELADKSAAWAALPLPADQQGKGLEAVLAQLAKESKALGRTVRNGSDAEITTAITALHETFHQVVGLCRH